MKSSLSAVVLKWFLVMIAGTILALAAFGIGVSVGATASASPRPALTADDSSAALPAAAATPTPARPKATSPAPKSAAAGEAPLDMALFNEAWELLQEQFYGELPAGEEITYAAIRGIVSSLQDEHTAFLTPKQAESSNLAMEGQFEGIGARVDSAEAGGVEIKYLFDEQPAQKVGILVGDVITAVDGQDVTRMDLNDAISLIRGPRGTQVVLTIRRGDEAAFDVTVTRARIEIPVVEAETLADGKIEHIILAEFSSPAPRRLAEALDAAVRRKPQGIILDLRGNPGGLLDAAVRIGSYFVPEGNILIERFKDRPDQDYPRQGRYLLNNIPLVVLIDGGSASASEIVAGAIQDAGVGVLIGEKTYGKGSVQLPNSMSDGSQLRVTIARWFTPKDREIHGIGLAPDIEVTLTPEDVQADRDPQLDRAVEYLLTGK